MGCVTEVKVSPELDPDAPAYFKFLRTIRWMIIIGCIDIITEISLISSHLTICREGNLEATLNKMVYSRQKYNYNLACDLMYLKKDHRKFWEYDWLELQKNACTFPSVYAKQ